MRFNNCPCTYKYSSAYVHERSISKRVWIFFYYKYFFISLFYLTVKSAISRAALWVDVVSHYESFWQEVKLEWWMLKHHKLPMMLLRERRMEILFSTNLEFPCIPSTQWKFHPLEFHVHPTSFYFPSQLRNWKCMKGDRNSFMLRTFPTIPLSTSVAAQIFMLRVSCRATVAKFWKFR